MTINGFNKNGSVYWEFINSRGIIDTFGYFSTNNTGGFDDYTIADDFLYDTYTTRFFDDNNNDYIKDVGGRELNATYTIPCNILITNNNELNLQSKDIQNKFFIYVNLERIASNLNQVSKNLESNNMNNAFQFAYLPHQTIFPSIKEELRTSYPDLARDLESLLTDLPIMIDEREGTVPQIQQIVTEINGAIKSTSNKMIGDEYLSNSQFIGQGVLALIKDAKSSLENINSTTQFPQQDNRAVDNEELEYQNINTLLNRALYQFERISSSFENEDNEERINSILTSFSQIGNYTNNKDITSLSKTLNQLEIDLNEFLKSNATPTKKLPDDINNYFTTIDSNLKSIVTDVKVNNDYKKADKTAMSAYLDNYEYLEAPIEKNDPELMVEIELNMREELRQYLKNNESSEKIELFVNQILGKLDRAKNILLNDSSIALASTGTNGSNTANSNQTLIGSLADIEKLSEGFGGFQGERKEMGEAAGSQKENVRGNIDLIRVGLQDVLNLYKQNDYEEAMIAARSAYLDSYEQIEIPLRPIDPDFTLEMEIKFAELRNLIERHAEYKEVLTKTSEIQDGLDESERLVSGIGTVAPGIAFSSSFSIVFREGLESAIIIGTILTYLEASRNDRFKKHVYYGIILAGCATAITWLLAEYVISISGASRELIEAIAGISAVAVLFWVSFWVLNRIETKKWIEFVKSKVWKATTTGSVMVFVFLSFFIVYREGFETVLFYQAMLSYAKHMEAYVILGFIIGLSVILGVAFLVGKIGRRLPLRLLFAVTMGVGAYMSITFLGNAIREFQEIGMIPTTHLFGVIPRLDINIATMTGIHPTLETIVGQIILLVIYLIGSLYILVIQPRKLKKIQSSRKSMSDLKKFD